MNKPDRKGWQDIATTDPMAISMWFREKPGINYGIRTGLVNNIVVIDLDGPEAREWWESTGIGDSTAVVYSPRKGGGQHHYFRVYDVEVATKTGKHIAAQNAGWHPSADVRGEGGLVAGPGSVRSDGVYVGDISNIPDAPQALLDLLPEKQGYHAVTDEAEIAALEQVEKATEPTESELSDLRHIETSLLALPRKWSPGDGWHDTVFRSCCWLWRMVRTPSYALTEHMALELMLSSTPVWPEDGWGEDEILKQWDSARHQTRGQFADPPFEELPGPLDFVDTVNELPQLAPRSQQVFFDILGNPNAKVKNLIEECLMSGLSAHQTVSVVHGSKAGESLRTDYGYRKLWRDVIALEAKAGSRVEVGSFDLQPTAEIVRPKEVERGPGFAELMSDAERELALGVQWWGTEYLAWTKEITPVWNGPYHRINRWTVLSCIFAPHAVIPESTGDMFLNLFSLVMGETTTGKTESYKLMNSVLRAYFSPEDEPDIGGDPSPSALGAALIERDGKSSLFNTDEADGQILKMKQEKGPYVGLMQLLTQLYEGEMPKMLRITNKEISNRRARAYFSIYYMGTFDGITSVLEPSDWNSGFLHRFIWAIGEKSEITRDSLKPKYRKGGAGRERDGNYMQKQWAAQFRAATGRLVTADGRPVELEMDDAFAERMATLRDRMYEIADERPALRERLYPATRRLSNSIAKASALVAVARGKRKVEVSDLLVALLDGEEWFGNVLQMVTATDTSKHAREVARIERMLFEAGGELLMEDVYRQSGLTKHATDNLVTQLIAEGRAEKQLTPDGKKSILKVIGEV